jgi:hypothetical protein
MRPMDQQPNQDPILLNLKQIAFRGGEKGPIFDQGVLTIINEIEASGHFARGGIASILSLMQLEQTTVGARLLTDEERSAGYQFIAQNGWTLDQGSQYANGVFFAEGLLNCYQRAK